MGRALPRETNVRRIESPQAVDLGSVRQCHFSRRRRPSDQNVSTTEGKIGMKLQGFAAVVTGGASGLGEATARAFAEAGVRVALFDLNAAAGEAVAHEIGGLFCHADVTDDGSVDAALAKARTAHGQERILINCAGTGNAFKTASRDRRTQEVKHFPIDQFNRVIQINLVGTFRCIAKSAAGMLTLEPLEEGERGVIINTASIAAEDGQTGQAAYSASKAAIVGLTLPVARDLMADGIRVNTILPGIFDTPLMNAAPDDVKTALAASVPFPKRLGRSREYASLALEMCRNSYFNGEDVRLDGAIRMAAR
jgi:NAD(P)-dependent dehydrogenase (short-subunit alcohol dehydrogenase family)